MSKPEYEAPRVVRRTFAAAKANTPEERAELNKDASTSEYMTSYRYLVRKLFLMSDGSPHPSQKYLDRSFRSKSEASAYIEGGCQ